MNDIDEFLEKRCKNDVLRKMKNVFQLQIMIYVIKTHQKNIIWPNNILMSRQKICPKSRKVNKIQKMPNVI